MQFIPWNIKDVLVEPDAPYSAGSIIYSSVAIGGVIADISGSWMNLAQLAPNIKNNYIYITAYIPADNIDISDETAINNYIKSSYITPAIDRFINDESGISYPTKWLDKNKIILTGNICRYKYNDNDQALADGETCNPRDKFVPIRYATPDTLPFKPEVIAKRYIVATARSGGYHSAVMYIPYINTNMITIYVPTETESFNTAQYVKKLRPDFFLPVPTVRQLDTINFFVKTKPE